MVLHGADHKKMRLKCIYNFEPGRGTCVTDFLRIVERSELGFRERTSCRCPCLALIWSIEDLVQFQRHCGELKKTRYFLPLILAEASICPALEWELTLLTNFDQQNLEGVTLGNV